MSRGRLWTWPICLIASHWTASTPLSRRTTRSSAKRGWNWQSYGRPPRDSALTNRSPATLPSGAETSRTLKASQASQDSRGRACAVISFDVARDGFWHTARLTKQNWNRFCLRRNQFSPLTLNAYFSARDQWAMGAAEWALTILQCPRGQRWKDVPNVTESSD